MTHRIDRGNFIGQLRPNHECKDAFLQLEFGFQESNLLHDISVNVMLTLCAHNRHPKSPSPFWSLSKFCVYKGHMSSA